MTVFIGIFLTLIVINILLLIFSTSHRFWIRTEKDSKQPSITQSEIFTQG